ncbi:MAG TPA: hypothetical protein VJ719_03765 [Chthoniobacterales bacterium]|nr:hypothetical protein [Chthoniobacterales bacterium]
MKQTLLALALVAFIPLVGFSQASRSPVPLITPPPSNTDAPGTATGLVTAMSAQTISVKTQAANPMHFALGKKIQYVNKRGKKVRQNQIRPGARVKVQYQGNEDTRTATKVTLEG